MSENRKPIWINTRVVLEWNGERYIETHTEGYWYEGVLDLAHNNPSTDQEIYRWRDDDGTDETDGTWLELANTTHDFDVSSGNVDARLRFSVAENGGADETNKTYPLEFSINGGAYNTITAATTGCIYYSSTKLTDDSNTTEQLAGSGTFQSTNHGQCEDGTVNTFVLTASSDVEFEYTVRFVAADLNNGDSINFRVANLDAYTVTANATITKLNAYSLACDSGSYAVTGTNADLDYVYGPITNLSLMGIVGTRHDAFQAKAAGATNYTLACDSGTYTITGTAAALEVNYLVTAASGTYAFTGTDVALSYGYSIAAASGSYTFSGTTVALEIGYSLAADSGSYSVTGTVANLERNLLFAADSGSYAITGTDVALNYGTIMAADSGSYSVTGTDAALVTHYVIAADTGAYSVAGTDAALNYGTIMAADSGSYAIAGTDAALLVNYVFAADSGSYSFAGTDVTLTYTAGSAERLPVRTVTTK